MSTLQIHSQRLKLKLVTKEDKHYRHKIFAIPCGMHFLYQSIRVLTDYGVGLGDSYWILFWFLMHAMLPIVSLVFHVPIKRNILNAVIWKEFQLHNIIFTLRSVSIGLYVWCNFPIMYTIYDPLIRLVLFLPWHMLTDVITKYYGDPRLGTSVRGNELMDQVRSSEGDVKVYTNKYLDKLGQRFVSFGQLMGSYKLLCGGVEEAFIILLPVQIAAFLMTLRRKGLISNLTNHAIYTFCVVIALKVCPWNREDIMVGFFLILVRFVFCINKYLLWTTISIILFLQKL